MAIAIIADVLYRDSKQKPGPPGPDGWVDVLKGWDVCIASSRNPHEGASSQAKTIQGAIELSIRRMPTVSVITCGLSFGVS